MNNPFAGERPHEYCIIEGKSHEIEQRVTDCLCHGWEPLGGVAVIDHPDYSYTKYAQAMIRYRIYSPQPQGDDSDDS